MGYEVNNVRQFGNAQKKFPIFMITLTNNPTNKVVFGETSLCYMTIKEESFRLSNSAQCYKCWHFGHLSFYCGYTPCCVKCAENYLAKNYPSSVSTSLVTTRPIIKNARLSFKSNLTNFLADRQTHLPALFSPLYQILKIYQHYLKQTPKIHQHQPK